MERNLSPLAQNTYDILIIGGGIYGACAAWEAASRGLSVALVERDDFGGATSSNSQKIIHGGFRYLQHVDFKRTRESVRERTVLMRIAPHLIHPLPVLIPTYGHGPRGKEIFFAALKLYDCLSFDRNRAHQKYIPPGHLLPKKEVLEQLPSIPQEELTGGAVFYDGQVYNSERLLLGFLHSATKAGADLANYLEVIGFIQEGSQIKGVKALDKPTGNTIEIRAKTVLNTSGPWVYRVLGLLSKYRDQIRFPLVKSVNLVTRPIFKKYAVGIYGKGTYYDRDAIFNKGGRLFFVTPWRQTSIIGTALSYYDEDPDLLKVTEADIQKLLSDFNEACPSARLKMEDVLWIHRGFLPSSGVHPKTGDVQISKHYQIIDHRNDGIEGLFSVIGVKYTTARDVSQKAIDLVFRSLGKTSPSSRTTLIPIHGGNIPDFESYILSETRKRPYGLNENTVRRLIENYGSAYGDVLQYLDSNRPGPEDQRVLKAEVLHAIHHEMALHLSDVIFRRTELGSAGHPGERLIDLCANIMADAFHWSPEKIAQEKQEVLQRFKLFDA